MEEFYIEYSIENVYESPVKKAHYELLILPTSHATQKLKELTIVCTDDSIPFTSPNIFGFDRLSYYIDKPFSVFGIQLFAKVEIEKVNPFLVTSLSPFDELRILQSHEFFIDNYLFQKPTSLTTIPKDNTVYFPLFTGEQSLFEYLIALNTFIYTLLSYSPQSTDITTSIEEVLQIRKGVCQDFAHLFIAICRHNKIPARYVTGYLNQGEAFIGASQLHAWAEILVPELGWIGFDATNNLLADHHYIKIAHGTDYQDCSPIVGVLETSGKQKSKHLVVIKNQQQ